MAKTYLVTGVSGSGKSTLETVFDKKGYATNDIDNGFAEWRNKLTQEVVPYNRDGGKAWLDQVNWLLRIDKLKQRIAEPHTAPLIIFGSAGDLAENLNLFDETFLLEYQDDDTIKTRLASRDNNPFGKHPDEVASVLSYYRDYQNQMKSLGATAIDYTLPLQMIVEKIEDAIKNDQ